MSKIELHIIYGGIIAVIVAYVWVNYVGPAASATSSALGSLNSGINTANAAVNAAGPVASTFGNEAMDLFQSGNL